MMYEIAEAVPHINHTVTVKWTDGAHGVVNFANFIARGGLFADLRDPSYFVEQMRVLRGGIGLTWPNEVDFSADGLRQEASQQGAFNENSEASAAGGHVLQHQ